MNLKHNKNLKLIIPKVIEGNLLKIIYLNINSLKRKINHITSNLWYYQTDLLIFAETHSLKSDSFHINGFKLIYRSDDEIRSNKGIICFLKENLVGEVINKITLNFHDNNHSSQLDMVLMKVKNIYVLTGYKSPSITSKEFYRCLSDFQIDNYLKEMFVLIGDFNFDVYSINTVFERNLNLIGLKRALLENVSTTDFDTQIDIIFLNQNIKFYNSGVQETIINQFL